MTAAITSATGSCSAWYWSNRETRILLPMGEPPGAASVEREKKCGGVPATTDSWGLHWRTHGHTASETYMPLSKVGEPEAATAPTTNSDTVKSDALILKAPKKSPLALRMVVFAMTMICGIFICSVCMKQVGNDSWSRIVKIEVAEPPCPNSNVPQSEVPFVHYPQPLTYSRNECMCTPVRSFAIISTQRSGSGWFETLLNSHINVSSNGEIFTAKERRSNISSIIKTMNKVYNLDWSSSASKNECTAAVGFKWMLNQGLVANHADIVDYFNRKGVSVIFLFRRNLLRQLVSQLANNHDRNLKQLKGRHKAHVHSKDEANILARYRPKLNTTALFSRLKQADDYTRDALENLKSFRHISIYYEDLIRNRTKLMDVLDFLKVPRRKLVSRHVKIHTRPLAEQIENWDEVYSALNGTQYESFLNSDYKI